MEQNEEMNENVVENLSLEEKVEGMTRRKTPLSLLEWIGSLFLLMIPLMNIVVALIFISMRRKSTDRSNYMLATIIILLAVTIISGALYYMFGDYLTDWLKLWILKKL